MRHSVLVLAGVFILSPVLGAQQAEANRVMIRRLTLEVIANARASTKNDPAPRKLLGEAASIQLELEDFEGFLSTARLIRMLPNSAGEFRSMSRNLVCYLLEDRQISEARRFAFAMADGQAEEDDWTRAHLAMHLLYLPAPSRDSAKKLAVDSAGLRRDAFAIARSISTPDVTTDLQIAFAAYLARLRDPDGARKALMTADSARLLIAHEDRRRSRAAMIAAQAIRLGDWSLVDRMVSQLPEWIDLKPLATTSAYSNPDTSQGHERNAFNRRILERFVELVKRDPDERVRNYEFSQLRFMLEDKKRKSLADSLLPVAPTAEKGTSNVNSSRGNPANDTLMNVAFENVQRRNIAEAERLIELLPDPSHKGLRAEAMMNLAYSAHAEDKRRLRERGLTMLLSDKTLHPRDSVLADVARERLSVYGENEMAIDIVNQISDVKVARGALADIGQSTLANLDAPKLRKLVDRIKSREVKDQVLFRLMISMLLANSASASDHAWALALPDSIRTPDLHARAKFQSARFRWVHGDSATARTFFLELLRNGVDAQYEYDRFSLFSLLVTSGSQDKLVAWARLKRDPIDRGHALLSVIAALHAQLPRDARLRQLTSSFGSDGCRRDF